MTAIASTTSAPRVTVRPMVRAGLVATVAASVATTLVALGGRAAGISLDLDGQEIPPLGFGQLTAIFSLLGIGIAVVLARRAHTPRTTFVRTTVALTALSLVPDVLVDAPWDTRVLLMATHLVAAAIVVPAVAKRLPE